MNLIPSPEPAGPPGWRRWSATALIAAVGLYCLVLALRMYFAPPQGGIASSTFAIIGVGFAINTVLLGFSAWWVHRWRRFGVGAALAVLVGNLLLVIDATMSAVDVAVLVATSAALALVISLMIRPE